MNNDNNLNGTVLGSTNANNNMPQDSVEALSSTPSMNNETLGAVSEIQPELNNNDGIQEGGQFFNAINDVSPTPSGTNDINNLNSTPNPTTIETTVDMNNNNNMNNPELNNSLNQNNEMAGMAFEGGMPGFENGNNIGMTPPISIDQNPMNNNTPAPKPKKSNKLAFTILIVFILIAIGGGTYCVLKYTNILNRGGKQNAIQINTHNVEININDSLPLDSDLATVTGTTLDTCTFDKSLIDVTKAGEYDFTITCNGIIKSGKVKVVDNTPLALKTLYKAVGDTLEAQEFASLTNNYSYEFTNPDELTEYLKTPGEYSVTIKATDASNNTKEGTAKLYVTENSIRGFLDCSTNPQNISGTSITMQESDRFGISVNDEKANVYSGLGFVQYTFIFNDEVEYNTYIDNYKTNGEVTINNITSKDMTYDNATKTITLMNKLNNEELYNSYGEETFQKYTDILNYYTSNLGRTCIYSK